MMRRCSVRQPLVSTRGRALPGLAVLLLALIVAACTGSNTGGARYFGAHTAGQHIYDRAGVLSAQERANLEAHAADVERAGAPTIVYLRLLDASYDETAQDGRDLMDAWQVESAPGAKDGLVIFLNLTPDDPRHGQVALVAGKKHNDSGRLPDAELQRIYEEVMLPKLKDAQLAEAIGAGLDTAAHDLAYGAPPPPPPTPFERISTTLAGLPLLALALLVALTTGLLAFVSRRRHTPGPVVPSTDSAPPGDLQPALVGALVTGRIRDAQMEATLLDLARRGAISIEPEARGGSHVQLHLLDRAPKLVGFEGRLWPALDFAADAEGIVSSANLARIRSSWQPAKEALRSDLLARGWYDPGAAARRRPLYLLGAAAFVVAAVGLVLAIAGSQGLGVLSILLLAAAGFVAFVTGYHIPDTSAAGEEEAAPWRAYLAGLHKGGYPNMRGTQLAGLLDAAMPYAVAAGANSALDAQLRAASDEGYSPSWMGRGYSAYGPGGIGFYPYWGAFHTTMFPPPSSGGGGGGGGASAGSSSGGGGF